MVAPAFPEVMFLVKVDKEISTIDFFTPLEKTPAEDGDLLLLTVDLIILTTAESVLAKV